MNKIFYRINDFIYDNLSDDNIVDLIKYTKETLALAIEAGGSTIRSYTSSLGVTGLFQLSLNVHTKEGEKCPRCNETIKKIFDCLLTTPRFWFNI